jgi:hypothetical protein
VRNLDLRLAACNYMSMWEVLRGVTVSTGDRHRLIIQVDHNATDPSTVVATCRARDADKL